MTYDYTWTFEVCNMCASSPPKKILKGRDFTYLEDPGIDYIA